MSIALNMLTGPFEEPFLQASLNSCLDLCDEFVLIDTAPGNNPNRELMNSFKKLQDDVSDLYGKNKSIKILELPRGEDKDFSFAEARELARVNTDSDWVLRFDADEVFHEDNIGPLKELSKKEDISGIRIAFYHFMVYPWLFQFIEPRISLIRTHSFVWQNKVHELPKIRGKILDKTSIVYCHYGYCRGQGEVFKRWKLYSDIDGDFNHYDGVNKETILDDRVESALKFDKSGHPKYVHSTLDKLFPEWRVT